MSATFTTGGFDPNITAAPRELELVIRAQQDVQNKHLSPGRLGQVLDGLHRSAINIVEQCQRATVTTEDGFVRAGALLATTKSLLKQADLQRKAVTGPVIALKEAVDGAFKAAAVKELEQVKTGLEDKMRAYRKAQQVQPTDDVAALAAAVDGAAPTTVEGYGARTNTRVVRKAVVRDLKKALVHITQNAEALEASDMVSIDARALLRYCDRITAAGGVVDGVEITETDVFASTNL